MHRHIIAAAILGLAASPALAEGPINLRGHGLVPHRRPHGGDHRQARDAKSLLGAGGVPAKLDPNGIYAGRAHVRAVLPAADPQGQGAAAAVARRRADRRYLRDHPGRTRRLAQHVHPQAAGTSTISDAVERGRSGFAGPDVWPSEPDLPDRRPIPFERFRIGQGAGLVGTPMPPRCKVLPGNQFPVEGYDNFVKQIVPRWLDDRRRRSSPPTSRWSTRSAPA